jgi:hypothetical protein
MGSWTHINSTLARNSMVHAYYFHANFPPTLIRLFAVVVMKEKFLTSGMHTISGLSMLDE